MHAPPASPRTTSRPPVEFGEKLARLQPFGQPMAMTTVRAEHGVFGPQMRADTHRDGFLTDVSVASAVDQPLLMGSRQLLLTTSNESHRAVKSYLEGSGHGVGDPYHQPKRSG